MLVGQEAVMEGEIWTSTWAESSGQRVLDFPHGRRGLTGKMNRTQLDRHSEACAAQNACRLGCCHLHSPAWPPVGGLPCCLSPPMSPPLHTLTLHTLLESLGLTLLEMHPPCLFKFSARLPPFTCDGADEAVAKAHAPSHLLGA